MAYEVKSNKERADKISENLTEGMKENSKVVIDLDACLVHIKNSFNELESAQTEIVRLEKLLTDETIEKSVLSDSVTVLSNVNKELTDLISGEIKQKAIWLKDENVLKQLSDGDISTKTLIELKKSVDESFNQTFNAELELKPVEEKETIDSSVYQC